MDLDAILEASHGTFKHIALVDQSLAQLVDAHTEGITVDAVEQIIVNDTLKLRFVNLVGTVDLMNALRQAEAVPHLGVTWFIPTFWVPVLLVTHWILLPGSVVAFASAAGSRVESAARSAERTTSPWATSVGVDQVHRCRATGRGVCQRWCPVAASRETTALGFWK